MLAQSKSHFLTNEEWESNNTMNFRKRTSNGKNSLIKAL